MTAPWLSGLRCAACLALVLGAIAADDPIVGEWLTSDGSARVRVAADGAAFNGELAWLQSPLGDDGQPRRDEKNPDEAKRGQAVLGLRIVSGLRRDGDGYEEGTVYDAKSGKTYRCKASLSDAGQKLKLRGFVGVSLFGRTEVWTRVEPEAAPPAP